MAKAEETKEGPPSEKPSKKEPEPEVCPAVMQQLLITRGGRLGASQAATEAPVDRVMGLPARA